MKAIDNYTDNVFRLRLMFDAFEQYKQPVTRLGNKKYHPLQAWTIEAIEERQSMAQTYTPRQMIWDELKEGCPTDEEMRRRLYYVFLDLGEPTEDNENFVRFDAEKYQLPSKDYPEKNKAMLDALTEINGSKWAFDVMVRLESTATFANFWIEDVRTLLIDLCQGFDYNFQSPEPQQEQPQSFNDRLNDRLKEDDAQIYFQKAISLGLMNNDYNWLKGLQMLACFAREMSLKLNMGKGDRISWRPFETLFGITAGKLRLNYNDIQKTGQDPIGSSLIDKVFE